MNAPLDTEFTVLLNTGAPGETVAITISKNGGSFANPSAGATNANEIGNGWYSFTGSEDDADTAGPLLVKGDGGGIKAFSQLYLGSVPLPLAQVLWGSFTYEDFLKDVAAALSGNGVSGGGVYRLPGTSTPRLTVTNPAAGERTVTRS